MTPIKRQMTCDDKRVAVRTEPMFNQVLPADLHAIRKALAAIRRRFKTDIGEDSLGRLELVLAEVMNNIAQHSADPGGQPSAPLSIHVAIVRHEAGLCCAITDNGAALPPDCLAPRSAPDFVPDGPLPESGWGWYIIRDLTQALCYHREGQRNYLAFNLPLSDEPLRH